MKETIKQLLPWAISDNEAALKNVAVIERITRELDKRIAKRGAEDQLRNMGQLTRANGRKL